MVDTEQNAVRRHKSSTRAGIRHCRRWSVSSSKACMPTRRRHPSRHKNTDVPSTCPHKHFSTELMLRNDVKPRTLSNLQLLLFVVVDDDAGIFLDSRDVPSSSRSASDADDLLPGTSRCTPSDIICRRLGACGCFCRCPLPFLLNQTFLVRSHASTSRRMLSAV